MEAARQELDGVRSLMTNLESKTITLRAQVRSLEADLASINRCLTFVTVQEYGSAPTAEVAFDLGIHSGEPNCGPKPKWQSSRPSIRSR